MYSNKKPDFYFNKKPVYKLLHKQKLEIIKIYDLNGKITKTCDFTIFLH